MYDLIARVLQRVRERSGEATWERYTRTTDDSMISPSTVAASARAPAAYSFQSDDTIVTERHVRFDPRAPAQSCAPVRAGIGEDLFCTGSPENPQPIHRDPGTRGR